MKSGALWVHCRGLALTYFGRDPHSSDISWRARRNFVFLSGKQRTISPISRRLNYTKFEHDTSIGVATKRSEQNFENFTLKDRFKKRKNFFKMFNVLRL